LIFSINHLNLLIELGDMLTALFLITTKILVTPNCELFKLNRFLLLASIIVVHLLLITLATVYIQKKGDKQLVSTVVKIDLFNAYEQAKIEPTRTQSNLTGDKTVNKKPSARRLITLGVKPTNQARQAPTVNMTSQDSLSSTPSTRINENNPEPLIIDLKKAKEPWRESLATSANQRLNGLGQTKTEKMNQAINSAVKPDCKDAGLPGAGLLSLAAIAISIAKSDCLR
jgi:hypothetical protein